MRVWTLIALLGAVAAPVVAAPPAAAQREDDLRRMLSPPPDTRPAPDVGSGIWVDWISPLSSRSGYSGLDIVERTSPGRLMKLSDTPTRPRPKAIPEPAVVALLGAGLLPAIALVARRRIR